MEVFRQEQNKNKLQVNNDANTIAMGGFRIKIKVENLSGIHGFLRFQNKGMGRVLLKHVNNIIKHHWIR